MNEIDIRQITEINRKEIVYREEHGDSASIELEACANNWEKQNNAGERPTKAPRCVRRAFFRKICVLRIIHSGTRKAIL